MLAQSAKPYLLCASCAFVMLEMVFALVVIGVAFGILAHWYLERSKIDDLPVMELDAVQERAFQELESKISPTQHIIVGNDGLSCQGKRFTTMQSQSTFTLFVPQACDKSKPTP